MMANNSNNIYRLISTFFLMALLIFSLSFSIVACGGGGGTAKDDDNEETVDADNDGYSSEDDCNDNNAAINPGATEIPNNDVDENCDGITLVIDEDNDGYNSGVDCDDDDPAVNPGATEICDGYDNDCDGSVDEGLSTDADDDGHYAIGSCLEPADDCADDNEDINPEAAEIPNNGIDENCDGIILVIDNDDDGWNSLEDCNDGNADINPDATEIPNNGIDENCDGIILVIDEDNDGYNSSVDCNDDDPDIHPGATEIPGNLIDEDCDGSYTVTDNDSDGYDSDVDCDDENADIHPDATEIPNNGIDEDCDGEDLVLNVVYHKWEYEGTYQFYGMFAAKLTDEILSDETTLLPAGGSIGRWASFSPDGASVVFSYQNPEKTPGTQGIYIIDLATKDITEVIDDGKWHMLPRFSPDGNWIVFEYSESSTDLHDLAIIDRNGTNLRMITVTSEQSEEWARFSPQGGSIIFHRREGSLVGTADIFVFEFDDVSSDVSTWTLTNLTNTPEISEEDPWYSRPYGLMIAFDANTGDGGLYETYIWNLDEDEPSLYFIGDPNSEYGFSWPVFSADGQRLYIMVNKISTTDLFSVPTNDTTAGEFVVGGNNVFLTGILY